MTWQAEVSAVKKSKKTNHFTIWENGHAPQAKHREWAICQSLLCLALVGFPGLTRMKLQVGWLCVVVVVIVVCRCRCRCRWRCCVWLWLWLWLWCVRGVVWCGVVCGVTRWKTPVCRFKTSLCVPATRPHVFTHVDVLPVHTGTFWTYTRVEGRGGSSSVLLAKICQVGLSRAPEVQQTNPCMLPTFSLRKGQEQHVAEFSISSLHLNTLFNSRHMTQWHTHRRTHTTQRHTATHNNTAQNTRWKRRRETEVKRETSQKREREKREIEEETGKVWELVENNTSTNPPIIRVT